MVSNPRVSVVMSVYNGGAYLAEAIESILSQTYINFEFIIVNDGSTDDSYALLKKYQEKDKRIILISRENKGLIFSLNEGISLAKGEYIARMDADDVSLPERFEEQVKILDKKQDVVVCGSWRTDIRPPLNERITKYFINDREIKAHLVMSSCFAHPAVMIRKRVLFANNIRYDPRFKSVEDYHLWTQLARLGKFYNIPKPLLKYRILEASVTRIAERDSEKRYLLSKDVYQEAMGLVGMSLSEADKRLHFIITNNQRVKSSLVDRRELKDYFDRIVASNKIRNGVDESALYYILGRRWLYYTVCHRKLGAIFSRYFIFGLINVFIWRR